MSEYSLHFYNSSGVKQAIVTDFLSLAYTRRVNSPGALNFSIKGDHELLDSIQDKWEVEVRKDGASEIVALFRDEEWTHTDERGSRFAAFCPGIMSILSWRDVNWTAGSANRSEFNDVPAETAMKKLVHYNIGPGATTVEGRAIDGTNASISLQTDASGGDVISWACHGKNLLETLQNVSKVGNGDFDLVKTGASNYEFRFYGSHLGEDKSASVTFSMAYGNMSDPVYRRTRSTEKTVAIIWGQGEGPDRERTSTWGLNYSADNHIETYVDARNIKPGDTTGLLEKGDAVLDDKRARDQFSFKVRQTDGVQYREDYDLGDIVAAVNPFTNASAPVKVFAVTVSLDEDGNENIEAEMSTP